MWKVVDPPSSRDYNDFPAGTAIWANNSGGSFLHSPSGGAFHVFTYETIANYVVQIAYQYNGFYYCIRTRVGSTWNEWVLQPARSEIDALNSKTSLTPTAYSGLTILVNTCYQVGNLVIANMVPKITSEFSTGQVLFTLPKQANGRYDFIMHNIDGSSFRRVRISASGENSIIADQTIPIGEYRD